MKKKLTFKKATIAQLNSDNMNRFVGGTNPSNWPCYITDTCVPDTKINHCEKTLQMECVILHTATCVKFTDICNIKTIID
ncbi:MAG: TIGR04149 family rSAM-modified RiPP [Hyphomicrobiales bacterium]